MISISSTVAIRPGVSPTFYKPLWQNTIYITVAAAEGQGLIGGALVHLEGPQGAVTLTTPSSGYWYGQVWYNVSKAGTYNVWVEAVGYQSSTVMGLYVDENTVEFPIHRLIILKKAIDGPPPPPPPPPPTQATLPLLVGLGIAGALGYAILKKKVF